MYVCMYVCMYVRAYEKKVIRRVDKPAFGGRCYVHLSLLLCNNC